MAAKPPLTSRADLLRALNSVVLDESGSTRYAELLGFERRAAEVDALVVSATITGGELVSVDRGGEVPDVKVVRPPLQATFFVVTHFDQRLDSDPPEPDERRPVDESLQPLQDEDCAPRGLPLPFVPLVRRERLWPRLRQSLQQQWCAGVDLPHLLQQVATRRLGSRVPLREHRHLSREIVVLWDAADRLTPYFEDYRRLVAELHRLHGGAQLRLWRVHDGPDDVWDEWDAARVARPERWPGQPWHRAARSGKSSGGLVVPPGCRLLLLSDLGGLARQAGPHRRWLRALRRWDDADVHVTAWVPHGPTWVMPALAAVAELHCLTPRLDRVRRTRGGGVMTDSVARQQRQAALRDELLVRASICIHLEPELLRSLRQTSPALTAEPGVEALAWAYQPVVRSSHVSRALSPEHAPAFRRRFAELDAQTQRDILCCVTETHASRGRSTEVTEVLIWTAHAHEAAQRAEKERIGLAQKWTAAWTLRMTEEFTRQGDISESARQFAADLVARTGNDKIFVQQHAEWTQHLWALSRSVDIPEGLNLQRAQQAQQRWAARSSAAEPWWLRQNDSGLRLVRIKDWAEWFQIHPARDHLSKLDTPVGQNVLIEHSSGRRWLASEEEESIFLATAGDTGQCLTLHYDQTRLQIEEWSCPAWADEWGVDQYGLYSDLVVKGVRQRLRYMPPGRFRMGSPKGIGPADEHPQHDVLLTDGFWLADTPCTQALWTAVMDKNPSEFKRRLGTREHPVESVSWNDVQTFLRRLTKRLPAGCQPTLPTETQWEYAARAGTTTAYWWGDEPSDQRANWNGQKIAGTTPVNRYPPNPWGLHDMHGNVWEWCLDDQRVYGSGSIRDPQGDLQSPNRAVRGGSWLGDPDDARSAYRSGWPRVHHPQVLGFRVCLKSSGLRARVSATGIEQTVSTESTLDQLTNATSPIIDRLIAKTSSLLEQAWGSGQSAEKSESKKK